MKRHTGLPYSETVRQSLKVLGAVSLMALGASELPSAWATSSGTDLTARGAYLVTAFGCATATRR